MARLLAQLQPVQCTVQYLLANTAGILHIFHVWAAESKSHIAAPTCGRTRN
jgi:hypothetical protein